MDAANRRTLSLIGAAFIASLAISARSEAQSGFGTRPTAGIFGGVTLPSGDFDDEVSLGWHAGALAKVRVYRAIDARLDGTYAKFGQKDIEGTTATVSTDASVIFGTLSALINLGPDSAAYPGDNSVSPYLVAGVGNYELDFKATCSGICTDFNEPEKRTHWGFSIGAGGTVPLAGIRTFLETRYHRLLRDAAEGGTRTMILVSAGVKFR